MQLDSKQTVSGKTGAIHYTPSHVDVQIQLTNTTGATATDVQWGVDPDQGQGLGLPAGLGLIGFSARRHMHGLKNTKKYIRYCLRSLEPAFRYRNAGFFDVPIHSCNVASRFFGRCWLSAKP